MYQNLRIVYFLERFFKYNLKNPLFWFVLLDYWLTKIIINKWLWFEANPIVDFMWNEMALLVSIVLVSLVKKWIFRWILIAWYCFIISRHILIILWVI